MGSALLFAFAYEVYSLIFQPHYTGCGKSRLVNYDAEILKIGVYCDFIFWHSWQVIGIGAFFVILTSPVTVSLCFFSVIKYYHSSCFVVCLCKYVDF